MRRQEALVSARTRLRNAENYAHPYYWASFNLYGVPAPGAKSGSGGWMTRAGIGVGALLLLGLGFWLLRNK